MTKIRDVADQTPKALNKFCRTLHPLLRPNDVSVRRRIGKHEPAGRIGSVSSDNVVGIDGVAFRFRHLFDAADFDWTTIVKRKSLALRTILIEPYLRRRKPGAACGTIGFVHDHSLGEQSCEWFVQTNMTC